MVLPLNREDELILHPGSLSLGEKHTISLTHPISDPTNFWGLPTVNYSMPSKGSVSLQGKSGTFFSLSYLPPILGTVPPKSLWFQWNFSLKHFPQLSSPPGQAHDAGWQVRVLFRNWFGSWEENKGDLSLRHWVKARFTVFLLPFSNWKTVDIPFRLTSSHAKLPFLAFFQQKSISAITSINF